MLLKLSSAQRYFALERIEMTEDAGGGNHLRFVGMIAGTGSGEANSTFLLPTCFRLPNGTCKA